MYADSFSHFIFQCLSLSWLHSRRVDDDPLSLHIGSAMPDFNFSPKVLLLLLVGDWFRSYIHCHSCIGWNIVIGLVLSPVGARLRREDITKSLPCFIKLLWTVFLSVFFFLLHLLSIGHYSTNLLLCLLSLFLLCVLAPSIFTD